MSDSCALCHEEIDQTQLVQRAIESRDDEGHIQWLEVKRDIEEHPALQDATVTLSGLKKHLQAHVEVVQG